MLIFLSKLEEIQEIQEIFIREMLIFFRMEILKLGKAEIAAIPLKIGSPKLREGRNC